VYYSEHHQRTGLRCDFITRTFHATELAKTGQQSIICTEIVYNVKFLGLQNDYFLKKIMLTATFNHQPDFIDLAALRAG